MLQCWGMLANTGSGSVSLSIKFFDSVYCGVYVNVMFFLSCLGVGCDVC